MSTPNRRVGCSTITFRHRSLTEALNLIRDLRFAEIDLGALPGVCDHVPAELDGAAIEHVVERVAASGLAVRSVNADVGDLNLPLDPGAQGARDRHILALIELAAKLGSRAVVLPCGRQSHAAIVDEDSDLDLVAAQLHRAADLVCQAGLELWVEALHSFRFCYNIRRAAALVERLDPARVGVVYDVSHVVAVAEAPREYLAALGGRVAHVHLRDAVPGDIHRSIGKGDVDFDDLTRAFAETKFRGHYALELETSDVAEHERPAATARAATYISELLTASDAR
jgi:sugar phosphate isomerase/epimerase